MRCDIVREAPSAQLDGEDPGLPDHDIEAHLGGCEGCRAWALAAGALAGVVERAPRPEVPLDPALLARLTAPADDPATGLLRTGEWRVVLALITVVQMVVAWPGVLLHDGHARRRPAPRARRPAPPA